MHLLGLIGPGGGAATLEQSQTPLQADDGQDSQTDMLTVIEVRPAGGRGSPAERGEVTGVAVVCVCLVQEVGLSEFLGLSRDRTARSCSRMIATRTTSSQVVTQPSP